MDKTLSPFNRFLLLDVMRALAVLMMIQGHSFDSLLHLSYLKQESVTWKIWEFSRGLTAPIFLFGSGFAYVLATYRKSTNGKLPASIYLKRLRWIGILFLTGSLMHCPAPTLDEFLHMPKGLWSVFFQVDVLRLMAVSLLFLLGVFFCTRTLRQIFFSTLAIGSIVVIATPLIHDVNWLRLFPEPIAAYFSMQTGSFFPIFPFMGYLFAGAAFSSLYVIWKEEKRTHVLSKYFFIIGGVAIAVGLSLDAIPIQLYATYNYWKTSPNLFLFRFGCVLVLWALMNFSIRKAKMLPQCIPLVGQHTLPIYVAHVVFLYGCAWYNGLNYWIGKNLAPMYVIGIIVGIIAAAIGLAYALHYVKISSKLAYRGLQLAGAAGMIALVFV